MAWLREVEESPIYKEHDAMSMNMKNKWKRLVYAYYRPNSSSIRVGDYTLGMITEEGESFFFNTKTADTKDLYFHDREYDVLDSLFYNAAILMHPEEDIGRYRYCVIYGFSADLAIVKREIDYIDGFYITRLHAKIRESAYQRRKHAFMASYHFYDCISKGLPHIFCY